MAIGHLPTQSTRHFDPARILLKNRRAEKASKHESYMPLCISSMILGSRGSNFDEDRKGSKKRIGIKLIPM